jgi:hypothetical protein
MATPLPVLDSITIARPCAVPWDEMQGDDRTRFCNKCNQQFHQLSELTAAEAERLLAEADWSVCVRLELRRDGKVMTADTLRTRRERTWRWLRRRAAWAAALFALVFLAGCGTGSTRTLQGGTCRDSAKAK